MGFLLRKRWLLALLLVVLPAGCLGGQTGDPTVACAGTTASDLLQMFSGSYTSSALYGAAPDECVPADTTLELEIVADLGQRRRNDCGVTHVLVSVHLTSGDGWEQAFSAWLDGTGELEPASGERVDPNADFDGRLSVWPADGTFSLYSTTLSTLPSCCAEALPQVGPGGAAGAAGASGAGCP